MKRWFLFRTQPTNQEDLKLIRFFIKKFGYRPNNLELFKTALTHKSVANLSKDLVSNERLEFLGDTILDAVIADYLYHEFPDKDEGFLTKVKSKIVKRNSLNEVARLMGFPDYLIYQRGREINIETLEGNAFEAVIGAIYLDAGYQITKKSILNSVLKNYVDIADLLQNEIDFKSQLYIWGQKNKLSVSFNTTKANRVDGKWLYEVEVYINSNVYGRGRGNTKKNAEQAAAKETLDLIG